MLIDPDTGALRNAHFKKYHMFKAAEMPPALRVITIQDPEEAGPFGAKSIGECATDAVAPAVVNAVNHALGLELREVPLTPARILAAMGKSSICSKRRHSG
jgi:xanthine dehydrogenase molybdenum-binding subunit